MKELVKCQHLNHKSNQCYGENIYSKVGNEKRMTLLNMVKLNGSSLKDAANFLGINYSTAKTILRVYRIENRILKKTPYQKKSRKNTLSSSVSKTVSNGNNFELSPPKENFIETKNKILENEKVKTFFTTKNSSSTSVLNNSGSNFFQNENESTQNHEEQQFFKNTEEVLSQFKSLVFNIQACINEVVNHEVAIQKMCAMMGINSAYIKSYLPYVQQVNQGSCNKDNFNMNNESNVSVNNNLNYFLQTQLQNQLQNMQGMNEDFNNQQGQVIHRPIAVPLNFQA